MNVLLKLPSHLLGKIDAILAADLEDELDTTLRADLRKAQQDVEEYNTRQAEVIAALKTEGSPVPSNKASDSKKDSEGEVSNPPDPDIPPPPTIDEEVLIALSKWATTDIGPVVLKRKGLDYMDYSLISLLAGTEVYVPPAVLARLKAAENPDKPNPFLPAYLSPSPPSLGSEYRNLTRNLSTVLNILFSIFGSAGAVYAAAVGGAGYKRESAMLLAILAGVVVGIADGVLVWIFSDRVKKGREEGKKLTREMLKGSAAIGAMEKKGDGVGDGDMEADSLGLDGAQEQKELKKEYRLRRRAVGRAA